MGTCMCLCVSTSTINVTTVHYNMHMQLFTRLSLQLTHIMFIIQEQKDMFSLHNQVQTEHKRKYRQHCKIFQSAYVYFLVGKYILHC